MSSLHTSHRIGNVKTRETKTSIEHEIQYFVLDADMDTYWAPINSAATWAPVVGGQMNVRERSREELGPGCWIVTLTARGPDGGGSPPASDNLGDQYDRKFVMAEMFFPMEWWRIHKANKAEAGILKDDDGKYLDRDETKALKNIWGIAADTDDMIFCNAGTSEAGTPKWELSPFLIVYGDDDAIAMKYIEQKVKITVYAVTFHIKGNMNAIAGTEFSGVNPLNGFSKHLMPFDAAAGKWRAVDQQLTEVRDKKGNLWTRVERKVEYAPLGLIFDKDKCGGEWKWSAV